MDLKAGHLVGASLQLNKGVEEELCTRHVGTR